MPLDDCPAYESNMRPATGDIVQKDGFQFLVVPKCRFLFHGSNGWKKLSDLDGVETEHNADWLWLSSCDVPRYYAPAPAGTVFQFRTTRDLSLLVIDDAATNLNAMTSLDPHHYALFNTNFHPSERVSTRPGDLALSKAFVKALKTKGIACDGYVSKNWPSVTHGGLFHLELAVHNWKGKLEPVRALKFDRVVDEHSGVMSVVESRIQNDAVKEITCEFRHHPDVYMRGGRAAKIRAAIPLVALLGALAALVPRRWAAS